MTRIKRHGLHNSADARGLKVALREEALEYVGQAAVLDLFAGPVGEMWSRVWCGADRYLGVDVEYRPWDVRPRVVCPWGMAVAHLDLDGFNVFDLDAFGSPWGALARLSERCHPAGRVAVVTTDGSWRAVRTGQVLTIDADLKRLGCAQAPRTFAGRGAMSRGALGAFAQRAGLRIDTLKVFATAVHHGGKQGGSALVYSLLCATRES